MKIHSNKLIHESSPYLLQHAHNPVDWYPWGEEALTAAKQENKPILVSIGYAACHWCHVMERESFENEETARIMNENFINIKIDREERPDLDHIYMDAVQAMTGTGGWPLNVFLTPDAKPFYGGTYFPPVRAFNRPSWTEILQSVKQAYTERRHEIDAQAENLIGHLLQSNSFGIQKDEKSPSKDQTEEIFRNIMKQADKEWGGFGKAPKFPQTFSILYLLRYYHVTKNEEARSQALLSLDKMIEGGIYDQLGGGFARYSTDTEWLAPHFEKMLYDNALLIAVISEAFLLTGNERYREVIDETMEFIQREMLDDSGGFYSALDADSEGVEGKFYVWDKKEVDEMLGVDAEIFSKYYDITEQGNWSHDASAKERHTILRVKISKEKFSTEKNIELKKLQAIIDNGKKKLLERRSKRIRPGLDDKIILGWNALMNSACSKAFAATGNEKYRELAVANMEFLLKELSVEKENDPIGFNHTWKNGKAKYPAFLDDYAFLVEALILLEEITGDKNYLLKARSITEFVNENFSEEETGFYFYTPLFQKDVIIRKKEVYDGAVPSGNSVMAYNLWRLSIFFDEPSWKKRSWDITSSLMNAIVKYPTSFCNWACLLQEVIAGTNEIVVVGESFAKNIKELLTTYIPHRIILYSTGIDTDYPLLTDKPVTKLISIYLCRNNTCSYPVFSPGELIRLINNAPGS